MQLVNGKPTILFIERFEQFIYSIGISLPGVQIYNTATKIRHVYQISMACGKIEVI